jgi:hypothetical protein
MRGISPGGSYFPAKAEFIGVRVSYQFGDGLVSCVLPIVSFSPSPNRRLTRIHAVFCLQSFG